MKTSHQRRCNHSARLAEPNLLQLKRNLNLQKQALLTVNKVASQLNVKPKTIRNWEYRREIQFLKVGSALRFHPEEIEDWLTQQAHRNG